MTSYHVYLRNLNKSNHQNVDDLIKRGKDLSEPFVIDFFTTFNDRHESKVFIKMAYSNGYIGTRTYNNIDKCWEVKLTTSGIINHDTVEPFISELKLFTEKYNGSVDGWIANN
ncbi:ribonuclease E inhibitor RraB [uncultured Vagococcus sp.]|uniref:ribonuclease E inhibitor RraB n=1 Tax=uncultured Vagococcus sp. TaxID=189676 RepID=UPI00258ECCD8|nr:ribonuclease E inhibitor RraB [uncultured Vagococcus sp.]